MPTTRSMAEAGGASAEEARAGNKRETDNAALPPAKSRKKDEGEEVHGKQQTKASTREGQGNEGNATTNQDASWTNDSSNILERGIIYFFFRGRVNVDEPQDTSDIARSFIILRPFAKDAKLGSGPIEDFGNSRLCVVPKKVLPQSGRDRWIAFVEKSGASFATLKETFLNSDEYVTKTAGKRHTPAATPIGEGVYALTKTGRESHLAYLLTLPKELGEVQEEIGLKERGSFIISTRNPEYPPPKNAGLPQQPEYPKEVMDGFCSLRWVGTLPDHLDYPNTQFLLIGESSGVEKATQSGDNDRETENGGNTLKEMEDLEKADIDRMNHLGEDDSSAIFADLRAHAKDYPSLQTTF